MSNKIKKFQFAPRVKIQLLSFSLLFCLVIISGLLLPDLKNVAKALTGDYSKGVNGSLANSDWNNLDDDFVAKSGSTMTGALTLSGDPTTALQAVTKQYVDNIDNKVDDLITNPGGSPLKIVCGQTTPGTTAWQSYGTQGNALSLSVNTTGIGMTPLFYITSLAGTGFHYRTIGASSVYKTATGFNVYITYLSETMPFSLVLINPTIANSVTYQWHINWCAVGS